jgi:hypothetical protein
MRAADAAALRRQAKILDIFVAERGALSRLLQKVPPPKQEEILRLISVVIYCYFGNRARSVKLGRRLKFIDFSGAKL